MRSGATLSRAACAILALLLVGCGRTDWRGANVVVIAIDTLRADHVGAYGYARPTTPRLDRLAAEGLVFETAISQSSWTLPAFASIFTGLLPSYHRAGEGRFPAVSRLENRYPTLATLLSAAGYQTASFVSNVWVSAEVGMARGFARHQQFPLGEQAAGAAIDWLREVREEPFFLFVHLIDPHQPYIPTAEDLAEFADPQYDGPLKTQCLGDASPAWTPADRRRVVDLYDGEVRWSDRLTGRVLDALAERGFDQRTIVAVTSDHGEELLDRGAIGHGRTLYDEVLRVPLMIRFPGGRRGRVRQMVRTMDLFPTLLESVGQPVPHGVQAKSFLPVARGGAASGDLDIALSEFVCFGDVDLKSVRTPSDKLLVSMDSGRTRLFDLAADPGEKHDVVAKRPEMAVTLRARLDQELAASGDGLYVIARSGWQRSLVRARLSAAAAFENVALWDPEQGDAFRLSPDGKVLDLKLRLVPETGGPLKKVDVDGVRFGIAGGRHCVIQRFDVDGGPAPRGMVNLGDDPARFPGPPPWAFGPDVPGVRVRHLEAREAGLDGQPRIRFAAVKRGAAPTATVSAETRERLRALGYLP
jgi:arylsulfatase A-like enzyme